MAIVSSGIRMRDVCHHRFVTRRFYLRIASFSVYCKRRERNESIGDTNAPWQTIPSGQAICRGVNWGDLLLLPEDLASQRQTEKLTAHTFCLATALSLLGCQCGNPRNANGERRGETI